MDSKLFFSTFVAIFLAELGDKTQLAVLAITSDAQGDSQRTARLTVFFASALALTATSALGVFGGAIVNQYVSPVWLKRIAGLGFVLMGAWMLVRRGE